MLLLRGVGISETVVEVADIPTPGIDIVGLVAMMDIEMLVVAVDKC